jgi:hypothetical protein
MSDVVSPLANGIPERVYDSVALERLLPHRYPFLLVDRIEVVGGAARRRVSILAAHRSAGADRRRAHS